MTILTILHYPDERLHKIAKPVNKVDERIRQLIDDMAETMYEAGGIGLAATQVDVHEQVIVMDLSEERNELRVFINAEIVAQEGEVVYQEGCLSVPGVYEEVKRHAKVTVTALDRDGQPFTLEAEGLLAICIQHEIDHLRGRVFVDYLSRLKQTRIKAKMKKKDRQLVDA